MSAPSALARHYPSAAEPARPAAGAARRLALVPDPVPTPAPNRDAEVLRLHAPSDCDSAAPLRMTRRGVVVVTLAVALLSGAVLAVAARSAPAPERAVGPVRVAVRPGDTLWALATRVAPQSDPRAEVAALRRLNHLTGTTLRPGQILRTR
jgi:nucleoid-associated protein YgaU